MQTKIEQQTFNVINYQDLNKLIEASYNIEHYDLIEHTDWYTSFSVYHKISLKEKNFSKTEKEEFNNWLENKSHYCYNFELILRDLCNKNLLPEGNLLIKVYDNG